MYGVPSDLDIKIIIGESLNQLGLGRYDVQLNFDGTKIIISGDISVVENGQIIATWNDQDNWSSLAFQRLLNATVEEYSVPNEHLLEIKFKEGMILRIHEDPQYESVQIYFEDPVRGFIII